MLDPTQSRKRQQRLTDALRDRGVDAVVVGLPHHVYYLCAHLPHWLHYAGFVLLKNGRSWLTAANKRVENGAIDEPQFYEARWLATLRQEQPQVIAEQIVSFLKASGVRRIGIDTSAVTARLALDRDFDTQLIDPVLWQLRRRKDFDELALLGKAADCAEEMFARAREIITPGVQEIDVFTELHSVAVKTAGEPLSAQLGNDYVCGGGGGPPRPGRAAQAGELYIIDVGPAYRGYFADACRTFSVGRAPTQRQRDACDAIQSCFPIIEQLAKPGARGCDLYEAVITHLKNIAGRAFTHHLGHGIGLEPHEFPHLNPKWDDVLIEGEIFAAEPAIYGPDLGGGIRIENNYLVTATGVTPLLNAPMDF
jgi:Xaa-Pro aminopeptidase